MLLKCHIHILLMLLLCLSFLFFNSINLMNLDFLGKFQIFIFIEIDIAFVNAYLIHANIEFVSFFEKLTLFLLIDVFLINRTKTIFSSIAHYQHLLWHRMTLYLGKYYLAVILT